MVFACTTVVNENGTAAGGRFDYVARDSAGTMVANGTLEFELAPDSSITGRWAIEADPMVAGPQNGTGQLVGFLTQEGQVRLNLNPLVSDGNVFLNWAAEQRGNTIAGTWVQIGLIGPRSSGTFVAERR